MMNKSLNHKLKIAFTLAFLLLLSGCDSQTKDKTENYVLPQEMSGCKVYLMHTNQGKDLYGVVCPNSTVTTTYTTNKSNKVSVMTTSK